MSARLQRYVATQVEAAVGERDSPIPVPPPGWLERSRTMTILRLVVAHLERTMQDNLDPVDDRYVPLHDPHPKFHGQRNKLAVA